MPSMVSSDETSFSLQEEELVAESKAGILVQGLANQEGQFVSVHAGWRWMSL